MSIRRIRTRTSTHQDDDPAIGSAPALAWVFPSAGQLSRPTPQAHRVGRGSDCHTRLPGQTISWHHAELRLVNGVLQITDLGSRNGTRVNGRTITQPTLLQVGDIVRCGEWLGCAVRTSGRHLAFGPIAPHLLGGATLAAALQPAKKAACKGLPIVLEGPTGTGKERAASAIHGWGGRSGEFVGVNCAAIPTGLAEAELFGHTKGAFSGADRERPGYLRMAHNGTLFLDEFAELPHLIQAKLLRALQECEVRPVGATATHKIDVLVLAAAQTPVEDLVAEGKVREDLAARLACLTIRLPRLEDRREDIVPLFLTFLSNHAADAMPEVETSLMEWLLMRAWPRNVRGLENLARTMMALHGDEPALSLRQLPEGERRRYLDHERADQNDRDVLFQRIGRALEEHGGNITRAASALGIDRSKVRRVLKSYPEFKLHAKP